MRSRSISPSTSIRSFCSDDSDSDDSDETSRYAGMTEEELNAIWERRNLAYFDRRQRLLAEGRERGDDSVGHQSSSSSSASVQRDQQQLVRPADYICAAQDPAWRDMTSRNIMGEYDPERAAREPAYHNAWISCQRLVNMHRSGATSGNYVPTNPRLAALMEQHRHEVAHARHEEQAVQRQQALGGGTDDFQHAVVDGSAPQLNPSSFSYALSATAAAQQAAAYERFNQAHLLQQQESYTAHAHGSTCSLKSSSSQSSNSRDKSVQSITPQSYHMALPFMTQQLTKSVRCAQCNCSLFTNPLAKRFFCQACGSVTAVPVQCDEARFEEKMQDAEDEDCQMTF